MKKKTKKNTPMIYRPTRERWAASFLCMVEIAEILPLGSVITINPDSKRKPRVLIQSSYDEDLVVKKDIHITGKEIK